MYHYKNMASRTSVFQLCATAVIFRRRLKPTKIAPESCIPRRKDEYRCLVVEQGAVHEKGKSITIAQAMLLTKLRVVDLSLFSVADLEVRHVLHSGRGGMSDNDFVYAVLIAGIQLLREHKNNKNTVDIPRGTTVV